MDIKNLAILTNTLLKFTIKDDVKIFAIVYDKFMLKLRY